MPVTSYSHSVSTNPRCGGLTLIELLFVLTVVAIIASLAVPAFNDSIARARVKDATESIFGLLLQARNEAPIRDAKLSLSIDASNWCVGLSDFAGCDCTLASGAGSCQLNVAGHDVLYSVRGEQYPEVSVSENFPGTGPTFSHIRRNASPAGTLTVTSRGQTLKIIVSLTGRMRICAPSDSPIVGYLEC